MHQLPRVAWLVLLTAVAVGGCGDATPTTPTSVISSSIPALSVSPSPLVAERVDQFVCPAVPPFDVPFHLLISTNDTGFAITTITARFVDTSGAPMPQITLTAPTESPMPQVTLTAPGEPPMAQVTLPGPVPTTQVGTRPVFSRDVPLLLAIGCGTGHTGTLSLLIGTLDGRGHAGSTQLTANVR